MRTIITIALVAFSVEATAAPFVCQQLNGPGVMDSEFECSRLDDYTPGQYWYDKSALVTGEKFDPDALIKHRREAKAHRAILAIELQAAKSGLNPEEIKRQRPQTSSDRECHQLNGPGILFTQGSCEKLDEIVPGKYWYEKKQVSDSFNADTLISQRREEIKNQLLPLIEQQERQRESRTVRPKN